MRIWSAKGIIIVIQSPRLPPRLSPRRLTWSSGRIGSRRIGTRRIQSWGRERRRWGRRRRRRGGRRREQLHHHHKLPILSLPCFLPIPISFLLSSASLLRLSSSLLRFSSCIISTYAIILFPPSDDFALSASREEWTVERMSSVLPLLWLVVG